MVRDVNKIDLNRTITHNSYYKNDKKIKKGGWGSKLVSEITENSFEINKSDVSEKEAFYPVNENFIKVRIPSKLVSLWGIGSFLFFLLIIVGGAFKFPGEIKTAWFIIPLLISLCGLIFFLFYHFTMPKKECILNRRDGLITFPGFMWNANITMPIKSVIFGMSGPSVQGLGAYLLQIIRPDKLGTRFLFTYSGICYEELSFWLWYMDKNRPLPQGDAFDEFREKDFENRKAAGFPKPLFPARFETPEATEEQQAERNKIGGW